MVFGFGMAFFSYQKGGWSVLLLSLRWLKVVTLFGNWFGKFWSTEPPPPPFSHSQKKQSLSCSSSSTGLQLNKLDFFDSACPQTKQGWVLGFQGHHFSGEVALYMKLNCQERRFREESRPQCTFTGEQFVFTTCCSFPQEELLGWIKCFYFLETPKVTKEDYDFCVHSRFNQG